METPEIFSAKKKTPGGWIARFPSSPAQAGLTNDLKRQRPMAQPLSRWGNCYTGRLANMPVNITLNVDYACWLPVASKFPAFSKFNLLNVFLKY